MDRTMRLGAIRKHVWSDRRNKENVSCSSVRESSKWKPESCRTERCVLGETSVPSSYITSRERACPIYRNEKQAGCSVAEFLWRRPGFNLELIHVGLAVDGVGLQDVYSELFRVP
jgi:hypothetical protein